MDSCDVVELQLFWQLMQVSPQQHTSIEIINNSVVSHLASADQIMVLDKNGRIEQSGTFAELQAIDGYIKNLEIETRETPNTEEESVGDSQPPNKEVEIILTSPEDDEAYKRQLGDMSLYKFYLSSVSTLLKAVFLVLAVAYIFGSRMPQIWLRIWTERGTESDRGAYGGAYVAFCSAAVIFSGLVVWVFFVIIIPKSATHLHWLLLDAVMKAPLWFFTTTDSGVTLNRFSQDMTLFDQKLPISFFETTLDSLDVIAGTALIASGAQYVAAAIPLCFVPLYFLQKVYLRKFRLILPMSTRMGSISHVG